MDGVNEIIHGDAIQCMESWGAGAFHAIITDPPYNTTKMHWDSAFHLISFWIAASRICKGNVVMFGSQPFTSEVISSNIHNFLYEWIWKKSRSGSALTAKSNPVKMHENIMVFQTGGKRYFPQIEKGEPYYRKPRGYTKNHHQIGVKELIIDNKGTRYPKSILDFPQDWQKQQQLHPTQKPLALMRYLIRTYTVPEEVVLDPFCGSGTTCLAAALEGRHYIGVDNVLEHVQLAQKRIKTELYLNSLTNESKTNPQPVDGDGN